jgi:acetyltransferase-like isoleucine patch superfamily enzyme
MRFFNKIINVVKKIFFLFKNIRSVIKFDIKIYNNGKIKLGKNILIERGCVIHVKKGCTLDIEDNVFIGKDSEINSNGSILISENTSVQSRANIFGEVKILGNCILGSNVYLSSTKHIFSHQPHELIKKQDKLTIEKYSNPILINEDCFIGMNVFVRPGIIIGKGCVVGANSNVLENLEPYSVVSGNPAKLIKKRLDFLPPEEISCKNLYDMPYFYSGFIKKEKSNYEEIFIKNAFFTISLNLLNKKNIVFEIFSDFSSSLIMKKNNIKKDFSIGISTLEFSVKDLTENFIEFECINFSTKQSLQIIKAKAY